MEGESEGYLTMPPNKLRNVNIKLFRQQTPNKLNLTVRIGSLGPDSWLWVRPFAACSSLDKLRGPFALELL